MNNSAHDTLKTSALLGNCGSSPQSQVILVVDDEDAVRGVCEDILSARGYKVLSASNGREAVELFKTLQNEVALVIIDVVMPVMNGRSAAKAMRAIREDLKVLFISGCTDSSNIKALNEEGFQRFLAKPFSVFQMQSLVDEILGPADV